MIYQYLYLKIRMIYTRDDTVEVLEGKQTLPDRNGRGMPHKYINRDPNANGTLTPF